MHVIETPIGVEAELVDAEPSVTPLVPRDGLGQQLHADLHRHPPRLRVLPDKLLELSNNAQLLHLVRLLCDSSRRASSAASITAAGQSQRELAWCRRYHA